MKNTQIRLGRPIVERLEQSECKIASGLMGDHTDLSLARMAIPFQVERQPVGYLVGEVLVPSQGTNAREWRVLQADHSLAGWTTPSEVQKN